MYSELSRVNTMVQALAVADRQREVTRSFSKKEHRHDDQTSTPLTLLAATLPLLTLSSMTPLTIQDGRQLKHQLKQSEQDRPEVQTGDDRSESHWRSTFCNAARSDEGRRWLHLSTTAAQ